MLSPDPSRVPLHRAARSEAGFGLIEVLVTAVVVIIVATAVFAGLDSASSASGRTKSRSIASTLAQRDQERLRALEVQDLSNRREVTTDQACDSDGKSCLTYTIESRGQWIADSSGAASCSSTDATADYLELVSTVTWPDMRGSNPVVMKSIYSPPVGSFGPSQGSLAVKLVGADGVTPMPGVTVRLTGPKNFADETNALGCVVWGYLPAGSGYTIGLNEDSYVDPQGLQTVASTASVIGETLTTKTFLYDRAAIAQVSFFAKIGTTTFAGQKAERITLAQTQMLPTTRVFPKVAAGAQTAIATEKLFPFKQASSGGRYRIFAGGCDGQDPAKQSPPDATSNWLTLPDLTPGALDVSYALQMPAIDTRITVGTPAAEPATANAAAYKVTQTTASCSTTVTPVLAATQVAGQSYPGRLLDMGRPYGRYTVCAQAKVGATTYKESYDVPLATLAGTKVPSGGATPGVINITSADTAGTC